MSAGRPRAIGRAASVFGAICAAWAVPAAAHPHIFIDYAATILCKNDAIAGVRVAWTFDEMYSASLFHDYTSRPKGPLGPADVAQLKTGAFQDTAEQHYFTDVTLNGKPLPITQVTDFDASYDGRKMTYRFTVPLAIPLGRGAEILEIDSFDTEFYIDFGLVKKDPVEIQGNAPGLSCAPGSVLRHTTIFGPLATRIVRCRYERPALTE